MFRRFAFTLSFAVICVAAGFYLASSWDTPTRVAAEPPQVVPAYTGSIVPLVDEEGNSPFVKVAEQVKPVVVNISYEATGFDNPRLLLDPFHWRILRGETPEPRRVPLGTGIIVSREGHILTNNHVASNGGKLFVKLADGTEHPAEIIGEDPETDVALIKIDAALHEGYIARLGDSENIRIGEWAIAIGNPYGLEWTLTVGVISARGRSNLAIAGDAGPSYQNFIQTDASINFGNSGGPLLNIRGEVIGINTAINARAQGIGFAIPINLARKVMDQLLTSGEVKRGYLGIVTGDLTEMKKEAMGIDPAVTGIFVEDVQAETPAANGGLEPGEAIIEIDDVPVKDVTDFRFKIADFKPGSEVTLTILNGDKKRRSKFKLADRKEFVTLAGTPSMDEPETMEWLGIDVAPTDGPLGQRLELDDQEGALVVRVDPGSAASGLIEPGDVIIEVGGIRVFTVEDYQKAAEKLKSRTRAIPFWVMRDGRRTFVPVRPG